MPQYTPTKDNNNNFFKKLKIALPYDSVILILGNGFNWGGE
jgi:hypothetical protein